MARNKFVILGKKVARTGRKVARRAGSAVRTSRQHSKISREEKAIHRLCRQLGEVTAEKMSEGIETLTEEERTVFAEIRCHRENIAECRHEIAKLRGMKECTSCGAMIQMDVAFCPKCGAPAAVSEDSGRVS